MAFVPDEPMIEIPLGDDVALVETAVGVFPERVVGVVHLHQGLTVHVALALEDGRAELVEYSVRRGAKPLTASTVHDLPAGAIVDEVRRRAGTAAQSKARSGIVAPVYMFGAGSLFPDVDEASGRAAVQSQRGRPVRDEDLRAVGRIVRDNPGRTVAAVKEQLHLTERTDSRWIAAAKKKGYDQGAPE